MSNRWYEMLGLGRHLAVSPEGALQAPEKVGAGKLESRGRRAPSAPVAALERWLNKIEADLWARKPQGTKDWIIPQRPTVSAEVRLCLGGDFRAPSLVPD